MAALQSATTPQSSLLLNSAQIESAKARFTFDPSKVERELLTRSPARSASVEDLDSRMKFALSENASRVDLERILEGNDMMNVSYLERGMIAAQSVGRVAVRDQTGDLIAYGTGFLISSQLMITNNHVIGDKQSAGNSQIEFNYELDLSGRPAESDIFALVPNTFFCTDQYLDFTVIAVAPKSSRGADLKTFKYLPLIGQTGKVLEGEYVSCIEHPGGAYKEVALRENHLIAKQSDFLWYKTDTAAGSSGSPMFNDSWQVVALHHSGKPLEKNGQIQSIDGKNWTPDMGEDKIAWIANEGVRISSIVSKLQAVCGEEEIIKDALSVVLPVSPERQTSPSAATRRSTGLQALSVADDEPDLPAAAPAEVRTPEGEIEVTVPLKVKVSLGSPHPPILGAEKATYSKGYDDNFLLTKIPLPTLSAAIRKDVVPLNRSPFIPYTHFTVCLSESRRLARFVAWNINGEQMKAYGRKNLKFDYDPRISKEVQMGDEIYSDNKLDRGHVARRADVVWGTKTEATLANKESCLFPNITPQHQSFNQSQRHGLWGELENAIFEDLSVERLRVSVIAGPILSDDDPEYRGVKVPQDFWKVLAYVDEEDGNLKAKAYVLTQRNLLGDLEAFALDDFRLYQVPIVELEKMVDLSFGGLKDFDGFTTEMSKEAFRSGAKRAAREVTSRSNLLG